MRIIAESNLRLFWEDNPTVREPLQVWIQETRKAVWKSPHEVKDLYGTSSILPNDRICFNIKGNHFRLIVAVSFSAGIVQIKFIGTHENYDTVNAETVDQFARNR